MSIHDSEFNSSSFFAVPKEDRESWLQRTMESLIEEGQARIQNQRNNLMGYLGVETDTTRELDAKTVTTETVEGRQSLRLTTYST